MSILQYPDSINAPELQIWNNAAFDNEESEGSAAIKASWSDLRAVNKSESFESDCSKENLSPVKVNSPVSVKSLVPIKPLCPNRLIGNSQVKQLKLLDPLSAVLKKGYEEKEQKETEKEKERVCDERKIDSEIEEIEKEISRLSSRLEALRLEKAERNALKTVERRGRIVQAKFMEPKQSAKNSDSVKKIEEPIMSSAKSKLNRRGLSLGPSEIIAGVGNRRLSKLEITPIQQIQSRRKSCFWKLQEIDELKVTKERGKSLSLSPKSRKTASKIQAPKQAATTVASKRPVKKEDGAGLASSIQPKKLFKDGEKSVTAKKPLKSGRVVASRYNQITNSNQNNVNLRASDGRKRSLPENDKEEVKRGDKRRVSLVGKLVGNQGTESRMKKKWEIPREVVVYKGEEEEEAHESVMRMSEVGDFVLPEIRTVRCVNETPRGSGPAKRVAELVGRRSYFRDDDEEEEETLVCQTLSFAEEDDEEV